MLIIKIILITKFFKFHYRLVSFSQHVTKQFDHSFSSPIPSTFLWIIGARDRSVCSWLLFTFSELSWGYKTAFVYLFYDIIVLHACDKEVSRQVKECRKKLNKIVYLRLFSEFWDVNFIKKILKISLKQKK